MADVRVEVAGAIPREWSAVDRIRLTCAESIDSTTSTCSPSSADSVARSDSAKSSESTDSAQSTQSTVVRDSTRTAVVLATRGGRPWRVVEVQAAGGEVCLETRAEVWHSCIVVGFGGGVWFVPLDGRAPRRHALAWYFRSLHAGPDWLLATDAERVTRFGEGGRVLWASEPVGADGVLVHDVEDGVVAGDGEWDPPGGWRPFALRLADGALLAGGA